MERSPSRRSIQLSCLRKYDRPVRTRTTRNSCVRNQRPSTVTAAATAATAAATAGALATATTIAGSVGTTAAWRLYAGTDARRRVWRYAALRAPSPLKQPFFTSLSSCMSNAAAQATQAFTSTGLYFWVCFLPYIVRLHFSVFCLLLLHQRTGTRFSRLCSDLGLAVPPTTVSIIYRLCFTTLQHRMYYDTILCDIIGILDTPRGSFLCSPTGS